MYDQRTNQPTDGQLDPNTGIFITVDGKRWQSCGSLDYGNNNCCEVMVLEKKPTEFDQDFRTDQYPVFIANHDDGLDTLGIPLIEFLRMESEVTAHHLPTLMIQLGQALANYK